MRHANKCCHVQQNKTKQKHLLCDVVFVFFASRPSRTPLSDQTFVFRPACRVLEAFHTKVVATAQGVELHLTEVSGANPMEALAHGSGDSVDLLSSTVKHTMPDIQSF